MCALTHNILWWVGTGLIIPALAFTDYETSCESPNFSGPQGLFILIRFFCLGWPFCMLEICGSSLLWRLLPVGGLDEWLVKVSWLGKLASAFLWVELFLFSLECSEVSSSDFQGVYGFGVIWGSMYFNAQGCVPTLLENQHGMSCSGPCWLLGGAWFQCRYGGFWMSSCRLIFPGDKSFLVFSILDLSFLPLAFSLIVTIALRFLYPYSTDD